MDRRISLLNNFVVLALFSYFFVQIKKLQKYFPNVRNVNLLNNYGDSLLTAQMLPLKRKLLGELLDRLIV